MKARNKVIAGDYKGKPVFATSGKVYIMIEGHIFSPNITISIDQKSVKKIVLIDKGVGEQRISGIELGGLVSGRMNGGGIYRYSVEFYDGKKSLIEIDEKRHVRLLEKFFSLKICECPVKTDVAAMSWSTFESQAAFDYTPRHTRHLPAALNNHYLLIPGLPSCSLKSKLR